MTQQEQDVFKLATRARTAAQQGEYRLISQILTELTWVCDDGYKGSHAEDYARNLIEALTGLVVQTVSSCLGGETR